MYRYNGLVLPEIPSAVPPNVCIEETTVMGIHRVQVYYMESIGYFTDDYSTLHLTLPEGHLSSVIATSANDYSGESWSALEVGTKTDVLVKNIVWANFNIEHNGTLYLAASDPVPVSPVKLNPALLVQGFMVGKAIRRNRT